MKQHTEEIAEGGLRLTIYPGADGAASVYEDDGTSFAYRTGEHRKIAVVWHDRDKQLVLSLRKGSNSSAVATLARAITIKIATTGATRDTVFDGNQQTIQF